MQTFLFINFVTGKLILGNFGLDQKISLGSKLYIAENFGPPKQTRDNVMVQAKNFGPDVESSGSTCVVKYRWFDITVFASYTCGGSCNGGRVRRQRDKPVCSYTQCYRPLG